MSVRVTTMAERRADRERAAIRAYMGGTLHRQPSRRPLSEIIDAGPWAGRWS